MSRDGQHVARAGDGVARLLAEFRSFLQVPIRDVKPYTLRQVAAFSSYWLLALAMLAGVTPDGHSHSWYAVLLLAALCRIAELMSVEVNGSWLMDSADIFYALAFVVLQPGDAALLIVVRFAFEIVTYIRRLDRVVVPGANMLPYAFALLCMTALRPSVDGAVGLVALVALFFAANHTSNIAMVTFHAIACPARTSTSLGGRVRAGWSEAWSGEILTQVMAQAPMAAIGVMAWPAAHWSVAFLVVPYLVAWRSAVQAFRLAEAEIAAKTDALTGLGNRALFFERALDEIDQARRYSHSLAFIMGDLDNFKRVNDTFGHLAGDDVLRCTSRALTSSVEDSVFPVARYGGEEFVVAIPVLGRTEVLELAERVRTSVKGALQEWGTTISLGVAYLGPDDRLESLIDRADKALYSAKYAGKDRIHEWRDDLARPVAAESAPDAA